MTLTTIVSSTAHHGLQVHTQFTFNQYGKLMMFLIIPSEHISLHQLQSPKLLTPQMLLLLLFKVHQLKPQQHWLDISLQQSLIPPLHGQLHQTHCMESREDGGEVPIMVFTITNIMIPKQPRPAHTPIPSMVSYQVSHQQPLHAHPHGILLHQATSIHVLAILTPRNQSVLAISCFNGLVLHHTLFHGALHTVA